MILGLAPQETPLAWASTVTWNIDTDPVTFMVLTGNTIVTLFGGINGGHYQLSFIQDGSGGHTVSLANVTTLGAFNWNASPGGGNIMSVSIVNNINYGSLLS